MLAMCGVNFKRFIVMAILAAFGAGVATHDSCAAVCQLDEAKVFQSKAESTTLQATSNSEHSKESKHAQSCHCTHAGNCSAIPVTESRPQVILSILKGAASVQLDPSSFFPDGLARPPRA